MSKICHRKATSNTGLVGITETARRGVCCFTVCWRPAKYVRKATTIYFDQDSRTSRAWALKLAQSIRNEAIAERDAREPFSAMKRAVAASPTK